MRAVGFTGARADPGQVGGGQEPAAGHRVAPHQRLLVVEQQGLVAGPHGGGAVHRGVLHGHPGRGEFAQQGEHVTGVGVAAQQPRRVGDAGGGRGGGIVDQVAAERGQYEVTDALGGRGARFGVLARDPPDRDHRSAQGASQRPGGGVEQFHPGGGAREGGCLEGLRAVAQLHHEGLRAGGPGEPRRSSRISPGRTRGAVPASRARTRRSRAWSGHSGCWAAGCRRQAAGVQSAGRGGASRVGASMTA